MPSLRRSLATAFLALSAFAASGALDVPALAEPPARASARQERPERVSARERSRRRAAAARARRARLARQRRAAAARRAEARAAREEAATLEPTAVSDVAAPGDVAAAPASPAATPLPAGAPVPDPASLSDESCRALLDAHGVRYRRVGSDELPLIVLEGPIGGIEIAFVGRNRVHAQLDCRVAAAILAWAPDLRAASVRRIRHLSIHRPGATVESTGRPSGHSAGLAMDVRYLDLDDGRTLDVLVDWGDRTRDASPCPAEAHASDPSTVIRTLVCGAVARDLFETVITPHHDEPHQNHVHVEVVPDVTWRFVR